MFSQRLLYSTTVVLCAVFVSIVPPLTVPAGAVWYVHDTGDVGWWGQSSALPDPDYWEPMDEVAPTGTTSWAPFWPAGYDYSPFYAGFPLTGSYGGMYVKLVVPLSNPHPTEESHITIELWRYADESTPTELLGTTWWTVPPQQPRAGIGLRWRLDPGTPDFNGELMVLKFIYDGPQEDGARIHWDGSDCRTSVGIYPEVQGLNPHVRAYIDFSPPDYVHSVAPEPFTLVDAYLVLDCFSDLGPGSTGMRGICFTIDITPGTSLSTSYTSLLPSSIWIGEWDTGITIASGVCVAPDGSVPESNGVVVVGKISMFYSGVPGDIVIADHPNFPRFLGGCPEGDENSWRVLSNGGVGQPPSVPGDPGAEECFGSSSAVQHSSWGAIKAMFR